MVLRVDKSKGYIDLSKRYVPGVASCYDTLLQLLSGMFVYSAGHGLSSAASGAAVDSHLCYSVAHSGDI